MTRHLKVCYYINKESNTPWDEQFVCWENAHASTQQKRIAEQAYNTTVFLRQYPNAKVEFVWSPAPKK